jgi:hypothetical protein
VVTRDIALHFLLRPILLDDGQPLKRRRELVMQRQMQVDVAYPFLTPDEQVKADAWRVEEAHKELWKTPDA